MNAPLIWHIEKYLRATGMSPSLFGRESAKDPKLVFDLRNGRIPGNRLSTRVRTYMDERGEKAPLPRATVTRPAISANRLYPTPPLERSRANVERELRAVLASLFGERATLTAYRERPWASATFIGARHYLTWEIRGEEHAAHADTIDALIGEYEFTIRGHIVADALVTHKHSETDANGASFTRITAEILTVEEG